MGKHKKKKAKVITQRTISMTDSEVEIVAGADLAEQLESAEHCPICDVRPSEDWTEVEWEAWRQGVCPVCLSERLKVEKEMDTGTVDHSYNSYKGSSYTGYSYTGYGWSNCKHIGDKLLVVDDKYIYGYAWRDTLDLAAAKVDYFIALDDSWLNDGELLMTPGVPFHVRKSRYLPHLIYLATPDYKTPTSLRMFIELVEWVVVQIRLGKKVGVGCQGGHGRTGLFMAAVLIAANKSPDAKKVISYVRKMYCEEAIESLSQEGLLAMLAEHLWREGADGNLTTVEKSLEEVSKVQDTAWKKTSALVKHSGPLPKLVRIKPGINYQPARDFEGKTFAPAEFGSSANSVRLIVGKGPGGDNILLLFEHEYEVVEPGDAPATRILPKKVRVTENATSEKTLKARVGQLAVPTGWASGNGMFVLYDKDGVTGFLFDGEYEIVEEGTA